MENPEEVLQALDEFQKLKPSEIPRELEDYLCFVAKTGDPVYQWSLIKPLFREKLVRVMTDFYESCPTLDLAPSPNIEQFNYDSMKGNLLDLLESFANAPFTVQRICELLTAPRKEYNRVDKFMRAIEKNILVVSTKEPGTRRSENGDSMINGTMEEETPGNQQGHEVEMESWVKDCTADTSLTQEPEVPLVETVIPSMIPAKLLKDHDQVIANHPEKIEAKTEDFTADEEPSVPPVADTQNPTSEATSTSGDVPEAIMNEDTSSQPSLETETEDSENGSKKLQTTFQSRDFVKENDDGGKSEEKVEEESKITAEIAPEASESDKSEETLPVKVENENKVNYNAHRQGDLSIDEPILEKRPRLDEDSSSNSQEAESVASPEVKQEEESKREPETEEEKPESRVEVKNVEEPTEKEETEVEQVNNQEEIVKEPESEVASSESSKVIVEEPPSEDVSQEAAKPEEESIVIEEAMDDDVKSVNSMVPDPIPIVEEPKEEASKDEVTPEIAVEEETLVEDVVERKDSEEVVASVETPSSEENLPKDVIVEEAQSAEVPQEKIEPAESMEVDSEESTPADEPMEQESSDQLKS